MLTIWSHLPQYKVLAHLTSVFKYLPQLPITVVKDFSVPPDTKVILGLGGPALKRLQEEKIVSKNRALTSYRTEPLLRNGVPVLLSYNPDIGEVDHGLYVDLLTDVALAVRYHETGLWVPTYGHYVYVPDFTILCNRVQTQHDTTGLPVDLTFDSETLGLDPYALPVHAPGLPDFPGAYIITLQATNEKGKAWVIRFGSRELSIKQLANPTFRGQLDFLLNSPFIRLKGADFKFDMHWIWVHAKMRAMAFSFDTSIVGSLLDENRSNALDVHTKIYVPAMAGYSDKFDREVDKFRMDLVPPAIMLPYAGGDVDADFQVAEVEKKELLQDKILTRFYVNILHPATHAFARIEQTGVLVDQAAYQELKSDLEKEHVRLVGEACKIIGGRIVAKHRDLSKLGGMNLTKASMLTDFMFSPMGLNLKPKMFTEKPDKDGVPKPSTAMEHLGLFADVPEAKEFVALIKEDSSVMKTYDTYVVGFLEHLRSDGRFHPTYFLYVGDKMRDEGGARTGRLSAKGPAWQTIPKHTKWAKRIRRCFPAPSGWVVVERDYSQGELRVMACLAFEDTMIAAYKAGLDLHLETSAQFAGFTYEGLAALDETDHHTFEETRQLGKAGNFGLLFGMKEDGFIVYAHENYGVTLDWDKAHDFREGFFSKYPKLLTYHAVYKAFAREHKFVRTPLGRIRHLPLIDSPVREVAAKAERQAINSPVQGCLTDMVLWSLSLEWKEGLHEVSPCFGSTHDSMTNYMPEDQVDVLLPKMLDTMENLPFETVGWQPQLKFLADAKVGVNLGEMKGYKR